MQVSNQSTANALLARPDKMDPQQQRLHKLFARKQAQIGLDSSANGATAAQSPASAAKAAMLAKLDPAAIATAYPTAKSPGKAGIGLGVGPGSPGTGTGPGNAGTIAPLPAELASELTVEGLMARWGSADTAYDLDKSGSVDMNDLVMLLSDKGGTQGAPPADGTIKPQSPTEPTEILNTLGTTAPATGEPAETPTSPELTMDGLMKAWGTSEPAYDLDGDGTVGMNDLVAMLAQAGVQSPLGTGATPNAGDGDADAEGDENAALTVDGFAAAWGTDDPMYDLDGDGTVGMSDLLAHLATVAPGTSGDATGQAVPDALGTTDPGPIAAGLSDTAPPSKGEKIADPPGTTVAGIKSAGFDPASSLAATLDDIETTKDLPAAASSTAASGPGESSDELVQRRLDPSLLGGPSSYWNMAGTIAGDGSIDMSTLAGLGDVSVQAGTIQSPEQAADIVSKQLHDRLEQFGFTEAPPANLHDILDGLRLSDGDRSMVLERMQGMYPNGLGLNLVG